MLKRLEPPAQEQSSLVDVRAREKLLAEHLPEVRYIARRIHDRLPLHVPFEDLLHAGVIGLIDAVDKFDPAKQVQLKSYAKFRIRGAILDSLRASDWSPRSLRRKARWLNEAYHDLSAALGRTPSESELARQLDMALPDFQHLLGELRGLDWDSLQTYPGQDLREKESVSACRPNGPDENPFLLCLQEEMKSHLVHAMGDLEERERQVLTLYYAEELTMKEVGALLGIGESRVSQIHSAAVIRLRTRLQSCSGQPPSPKRRVPEPSRGNGLLRSA
jgi:RNA polymerase sigma factor for flagellar operon FliA